MEGGVTSTKVVVCAGRSGPAHRSLLTWRETASQFRLTHQLQAASSCLQGREWVGESPGLLSGQWCIPGLLQHHSRTRSQSVTPAVHKELRAAPTLASPELVHSSTNPHSPFFFQLVIVTVSVLPAGASSFLLRPVALVVITSCFSHKQPLPQAFPRPPTHATPFPEHGTHGGLVCVCCAGARWRVTYREPGRGEQTPSVLSPPPPQRHASPNLHGTRLAAPRPLLSSPLPSAPLSLLCLHHHRPGPAVCPCDFFFYQVLHGLCWRV